MASSVDTSTVGGGVHSVLMVEVPPFGLLDVELVAEDGHVIATDSLTDSYGEGTTAHEAVEALSRAIRRHYTWLQDQGVERLSERFQFQLIQLRLRAARANLASSVLPREKSLPPAASTPPGTGRAWAA